MTKEEVENSLDIHAKLNGCVSYYISGFIAEITILQGYMSRTG